MSCRCRQISESVQPKPPTIVTTSYTTSWDLTKRLRGVPPTVPARPALDVRRDESLRAVHDHYDVAGLQVRRLATERVRISTASNGAEHLITLGT